MKKIIVLTSNPSKEEELVVLAAANGLEIVFIQKPVDATYMFMTEDPIDDRYKVPTTLGNVFFITKKMLAEGVNHNEQ